MSDENLGLYARAVAEAPPVHIDQRWMQEWIDEGIKCIEVRLRAEVIMDRYDKERNGQDQEPGLEA